MMTFVLKIFEQTYVFYPQVNLQSAFLLFLALVNE